jgi:hypothetical protein
VGSRVTLADDLDRVVCRAVVHDDHAMVDGLALEALQTPLEELAPVPRRNDDVDRRVYEFASTTARPQASGLNRTRRRATDCRRTPSARHLTSQ